MGQQFSVGIRVTQGVQSWHYSMSLKPCCAREFTQGSLGGSGSLGSQALGYALVVRSIVKSIKMENECLAGFTGLTGLCRARRAQGNRHKSNLQ